MNPIDATVTFERGDRSKNEHKHKYLHMITVITRFAVPAKVSTSEMRNAFAQVAPAFRNVPHLVRKQFLLSPDGRTAGGVYLWEDEAAARPFMKQSVAPMIRDKFHVEPTIEFYDSPVIVENVQPHPVPA